MSSLQLGPAYVREFSDTLVSELFEQLRQGEHLALVAPRQSGKALLLYELRRRAAVVEGVKPRVVILRRGTINSDSAVDWIRELRECLVGVTGKATDKVPDEVDPEAGLSDQFRGIIETAAGSETSPLWLFIQSIPEFPAPWARAMLLACQWFSMDPLFRSKLSVVVTGSHDLVSLAYDYNSPYRHAQKYFLNGFDKDLTRRFFCARIRGESLEQGFGSDTQPDLLEPAALNYLYEQTGGYARFIEELVSTLRRPGMTQQPIGDEGLWGKAWIAQLVERFINEHLQFEPFCQLNLSDVEREPAAWDTLCRMLGARESGETISAATNLPHRLETSGIARRTKPSGELRMACPIWERYLRSLMTRVRRGDIMALQGRWDEAWDLYSTVAAAECDRPLDGESRYLWRRVVRLWEEALSDEADRTTKLPTTGVWRFFERGLKTLYGFQTGVLCDRRTAKSHWEFGNGKIELLRYVGAGSKAVREWETDALAASERLCRVVDARSRVVSKPEKEGTWTHFRIAPTLILERSLERDIDAITRSELRRSLKRFWSAMETACRKEFDAELGGVRERHMRVIEVVNRLPGRSMSDLGTLVNETCRALVVSGGYFRVLISLVSPDGNYIQGVAAHSRHTAWNFKDRTNCPLVPGVTGGKPDIQAWVVLNRQSAVVPDAAQPGDSEFVTNVDQAEEIHMRGIAVIPIQLTEEGGRNPVQEILGTLHVERNDGQPPGNLEVRSLEILAGQIASVFDQERRRAMLEQALEQVDSEFRLVARNGRVLYRNRAAAIADQQPARIWNYPLAVAPMSETEEECQAGIVSESIRNGLGGNFDPQHRFRESPGDRRRVWDDLVAPVFDFRKQLLTPFGSDGWLGLVHQSTELTDLVELSQLLQKVLSVGGLPETTHRILEFFRQRGHQWVRIYLHYSSRLDGEYLASCDEFGIEDQDIRHAFRLGRFRFDRSAVQEQAWLLLDRLKEPAIFHWDSTCVNGPEMDGEWIPGIPKVRSQDRWRREFNKTDQEWLEVPLFVGSEMVGIIAMDLPADFAPRVYEQIRWAGASIAVALHFSRLTVEETTRAKRAGSVETAAMAIHQLANILGPAVSRCAFIQHDLRTLLMESEESAAVLADLERVISGIKGAHAILADFGRYAADKPLRDIQPINSVEFLDGLLARIRERHPDLQIHPPEYHMDPMANELILHASPQALYEVFEILAANSERHAQRTHDRVEIRVQVGPTIMAGEQSRCQIRYRDNGPGIAPNAKERIFAAFFTTSARGTGLGLPIARRLLEQMGGTIWEEGDFGVGCCFTVEIPMARSCVTDPGDSL